MHPILVVPNAWYVRPNDQGNFEFTKIPAGSYQVVVWHKSAGFFRKQIQVTVGGAVNLSMEIPIGANRTTAMTRQISFATRAFLFAFIPMVVTLVVSFVLVSKITDGRIKGRLRESIQKTEAVLSRSEADYNQRNLSTLSALAENPSLKAGVGLLRETGTPQLQEQVRETLAGQLRQIGGSLDYDLLMLQDARDVPVAGVIGKQRTRLKLESSPIETVASSLVRIGGKLYEISSVPINLGNENLATLTLGKAFNTAGWNEFGNTALFLNGKILYSTFPPDRSAEVERQVSQRCSPASKECEVAVSGETYLALPVRQETFKNGVRLVSFQSIDAATRELTQSLGNTFLLIGGCGVLLIMLVSAVGARSIAKPLVTLIEQLRREGSAGGFSAKLDADYQAVEVNELALEFTRAAGAMRDSERRLDEATEQFIESMAQAQDARDPYTAGHSERVSEISIAIASQWDLVRRSGNHPDRSQTS